MPGRARAATPLRSKSTMRSAPVRRSPMSAACCATRGSVRTSSSAITAGGKRSTSRMSFPMCRCLPSSSSSTIRRASISASIPNSPRSSSTIPRGSGRRTRSISWATPRRIGDMRRRAGSAASIPPRCAGASPRSMRASTPISCSPIPRPGSSSRATACASPARTRSSPMSRAASSPTAAFTASCAHYRRSSGGIPAPVR